MYDFSGFEGLLAFNYTASYCFYASDAPVASRIKHEPTGSQPLKRESFYHQRDLSQAIVYPLGHHKINLYGIAKGLQALVEEKG